ncbi:hypothetical protein AJ79_05795 [Helicocarpus griseus UAMH5409]|uniref:HPP transmembrane region domain-containing protein n=1 Tax=Helicocarpus griseus UAMH5409 TaxID=1447875 RepID=A0A2B7XJA4_9EURO|nr:hypothetical protein AJ79_05795 [Helicocarpus griseus UAMH5409]
MPLPNIYDWDLDIDRLLNRFVPYPRWHLLPGPIAHFLGHRTQTPPKKPGNVLVTLWSVLGVFCGLTIVAAVTTHIPIIQERGGYTIVGSYGAAAVLEYCTIDSPLAQPRNALLGQTLSAVIGVGISKLFAMHPSAETLFWLAGPLGCALAVAVMVFTKSVHPPAGATALLASTDPSTRHLGWLLVPLIVLSSSLILTTALLVNNIQRRFPLYWWTPESLKPVDEPEKKDVEMSSSDDERTNTGSSMQGEITKGQMIMVQRGQLMISDGLYLTDEEVQLLERLSQRI